MRNPLATEDTYRNEERIEDLQAEVKRLTNKLNENNQNFQIECQKVEIEMLRVQVERLREALQTVIRIRERATRGSVGSTLGWKDEAVEVARSALVEKG